MALNLNKINIAGNSFGGLLTWKYSILYSNKISKMILIDPIAYPSNPPFIFDLVSFTPFKVIKDFYQPKMLIKKNIYDTYCDNKKISDRLLNRYYEINNLLSNKKGVSIVFTEDGLRLLANISQWVTSIIVNRLGKEEFVLNYSSTVPRQMSLLLFIAFIEHIKSNELKINIKHILKSVMKWTQQLKNLPAKISD